MCFLAASPPASAQGAAPPPSTPKKAKEKVAGPEAGGMTRQKRLALCLETWDAQTHMSRREWRVACERSVKDYPEAFN